MGERDREVAREIRESWRRGEGNPMRDIAQALADARAELQQVIDDARIVCLANPHEAFAILGGDWTLLAAHLQRSISPEIRARGEQEQSDADA